MKVSSIKCNGPPHVKTTARIGEARASVDELQERAERMSRLSMGNPSLVTNEVCSSCLPAAAPAWTPHALTPLHATTKAQIESQKETVRDLEDRAERMSQISHGDPSALTNKVCVLDAGAQHGSRCILEDDHDHFS